MLILSTGMLSILILSTGMLSILISLEFLVMGLFFMLLVSYSSFGVMEIVGFMVFSVLEALMGLILLVVSVMITGEDMVWMQDGF
uniref:NADH dehydrogenase subunit 4L n=1 Tax=Blattisocius tarsalis TaxID=1609195 RepID=A0A6B9WEW8_9ACAR|nr:NADH dehydrogenase subunit 4L [Blattisocius tarsalis]QHQ98572.1 NADH dehydrogenase subunit 4L [Blattisocius tarsalis]